MITDKYPPTDAADEERKKTRKRITILTPHIAPSDHDKNPEVVVKDDDNNNDENNGDKTTDDFTDQNSGDVVTINYDLSDEELYNSVKEQLNSIADKYKDLLEYQISFQGLFGWLNLYHIIFSHGREGLEDYLNEVFQEIKDKIEKTAKDRKNRQYVILADGSVFIVIDNSETNYCKYWKVYYDTIRVPACQNIFHMIREQKHIKKRYSYVSGPTTSLPDEDYWTEQDYCVGYEMHEEINVFWKEGDVFYGDKPLAVYFPTETIDPLNEAFQKMKASLGTITEDGKSVKVKQSTTEDDGSLTVTETELPSSFFTQPHTLGELINLGLIVGDFNARELYTTLSREDIEFIIEIYGVKK